MGLGEKVEGIKEKKPLKHRKQYDDYKEGRGEVKEGTGGKW